MRWALLGLMLAVSPANAQVIYRCQAGGKVTLQSDPCPVTAKQTVRPYQATPSDPHAVRRRMAIEAEMDRRNAGGQARVAYGDRVNNRTYYNGELISTSPDPRRGRCEAAKRDRAAVLERVGLRRNFDLLRRLDEQVRIACAR